MEEEDEKQQNKEYENEEQQNEEKWCGIEDTLLYDGLLENET